MTEIKIMTVSSATHLSIEEAKIMLSGLLLEQAGFTAETLVTVSCENGTLLVQAHGTGMEVYRQIVGEVRKKKHHMIQVVSKILQKKTYTLLTLQGALIEKYGFRVGDVIVVHFEKNLLKIKRLSLEELGFERSTTAHTRVLTVQIGRGRKFPLPSINFKGYWLGEIGFHIGGTAGITYDRDMLIFRGYKEKKCLFTHSGKPSQVSIIHHRQIPRFEIKGLWLEELGYHIGDVLIARYEHGIIRLKRLDLDGIKF